MYTVKVLSPNTDTNNTNMLRSKIEARDTRTVWKFILNKSMQFSFSVHYEARADMKLNIPQGKRHGKRRRMARVHFHSIPGPGPDFHFPFVVVVAVSLFTVCCVYSIYK